MEKYLNDINEAVRQQELDDKVIEVKDRMSLQACDYIIDLIDNCRIKGFLWWKVK